jgi:hypothetical protein
LKSFKPRVGVRVVGDRAQDVDVFGHCINTSDRSFHLSNPADRGSKASSNTSVGAMGLPQCTVRGDDADRNDRRATRGATP